MKSDPSASRPNRFHLEQIIQFRFCFCFFSQSSLDDFILVNSVQMFNIILRQHISHVFVQFFYSDFPIQLVIFAPVFEFSNAIVNFLQNFQIFYFVFAKFGNTILCFSSFNFEFLNVLVSLSAKKMHQLHFSKQFAFAKLKKKMQMVADFVSV